MSIKPHQDLITRAEYARHRGCSYAAVCKAIDSGRITSIEKGGKVLVDRELADAQWSRNTRAMLGAPAPPTVPSNHETAATIDPPHDIAAARAKREHHEANIAAMREAEKAGRLVEADAVARAAADIGAAFAEAAGQLIQLAKELAAESDPVKVRTMIEARVNAALTDAADRLEAMASSRGSR